MRSAYECKKQLFHRLNNANHAAFFSFSVLYIWHEPCCSICIVYCFPWMSQMSPLVAFACVCVCFYIWLAAIMWIICTNEIAALNDWNMKMVAKPTCENKSKDCHRIYELNAINYHLTICDGAILHRMGINVRNDVVFCRLEMFCWLFWVQSTKCYRTPFQNCFFLSLSLRSLIATHLLGAKFIIQKLKGKGNKLGEKKKKSPAKVLTRQKRAPFTYWNCR